MQIKRVTHEVQRFFLTDYSRTSNREFLNMKVTHRFDMLRIFRKYKFYTFITG